MGRVSDLLEMNIWKWCHKPLVSSCTHCMKWLRLDLATFIRLIHNKLRCILGSISLMHFQARGFLGPNFSPCMKICRFWDFGEKNVPPFLPHDPLKGE